MKILNGYCGLGGNRRLWPNDEIEVTAIEINHDIAKIYQDFFPDDKIIITDAHQYLLEHYKEYDFIWSSPPCSTHSDIRRCGVHRGIFKAVYPDMRLYQEIILLQTFFKGKYCIENVKPYYTPLIKAQEINRHLFWTNFYININNLKDDRKHEDIKDTSTIYGINLNKYKIDNKRKILRNMVNPKLGLYIFNAAFKNIQLSLI